MFGNVRQAFGTILENLRKSSESGRKSSENHQKRHHHYVSINYLRTESEVVTGKSQTEALPY